MQMLTLLLRRERTQLLHIACVDTVGFLDKVEGGDERAIKNRAKQRERLHESWLSEGRSRKLDAPSRVDVKNPRDSAGHDAR